MSEIVQLHRATLVDERFSDTDYGVQPIPALDIPQPTEPLHIGRNFAAPVRRGDIDPSLPMGQDERPDWRYIALARVRRVATLLVLIGVGAACMAIVVGSYPLPIK